MAVDFKINLRDVIIVAVVIFLLFGGGFGLMNQKLTKTKDELGLQKNLNVALQDTIHRTLNMYDEIVSEKNTLQASVEKLSEDNLNLTENQKELVERVNGLEKDNDVISAALIKTKAQLHDALFAGSTVLQTDSTITFKEANDSISFDLTVMNIRLLPPKKKPLLLISELTIPNKQFISFKWGNIDNNNQKPISFSVTNSNPLYSVYDVDSYTIPEIKKRDIKPTGWERTKEFFNESKDNVFWGAIGFGIGAFIGMGR